MPPKKSKVKLGLKNLALLPSYFDYIFVHLRQKARHRPELSPKFLSTLGPNPIGTRKARFELLLCAVPLASNNLDCEEFGQDGKFPINFYAYFTVLFTASSLYTVIRMCLRKSKICSRHLNKALL